MKKILTLIILFTSLTLAQSEPLLNLFDGGYKNAETILYLKGQTVSGAQATRIDNFISMVKDSLGISALSSKFDVMYLLANETQTLSKLNIVKRSSDITKDTTTSDGITWTQWQGFQGTGLTGRLNTHYSDSTDAVNFARNSGSIGIYSRTDKTEAAVDFAVIQNSAVRLYLRYTDNNIYYTFLSDDIHQGGAANTDSRGFFIMSATSLTNVAIYRNGSSLGSISNNVVGLRNTVPYYIIGYNDDNTVSRYPTTRQYSFFFVGSGLDATQARKLNNCVEYYMDSLGTGVE